MVSFITTLTDSGHSLDQPLYGNAMVFKCHDQRNKLIDYCYSVWNSVLPWGFLTHPTPVPSRRGQHRFEYSELSPSDSSVRSFFQEVPNAAYLHFCGQRPGTVRQISNTRAPNPQHISHLVLQLVTFVQSIEADRRCSNYIWVIPMFMAF